MVRLIARRVLWVALLSAIASAAAAQPAAPSSDDWQFTVAPYMVIAGMSGTVGVKGFDSTLDMSASDVLNHLSAGFMGSFAAEKRNWGFAADTFYAKLSTEVTRTNVTVAPDVSLGLYTFLATRQLTPVMTLLAGARVTSATTTLALTSPVQRETSDDKTWVDPIVGVNIVAPAGARTKLMLLANVGGFGTASTMSVDLQPAVQFRLASHAWLAAGYRYIYDNYSDDAGFVYKVAVQGPAIGVVFPF